MLSTGLALKKVPTRAVIDWVAKLDPWSTEASSGIPMVLAPHALEESL